MKSFRTRIILWTTVIAGAVMLGFGIAGNIAFEQIKTKQVDDILRITAELATPPPSHARFWSRFGADSHADLEERFSADAVLAVYGRRLPKEGEEPQGYEINHWGDLEGLFPNEAELPVPDGYFDPFQDRARGPPEGPIGFGGRERGARLDAMRLDGPRPDAPRLEAPREEGPPPVFQSFSKVSSKDGSHWRILQASHPGYIVLVAVNFEKVRKDTALMRKAFGIVFPIALLAMASCIWFFVTKAISPVRRLSHTIASVSAQSLGSRLESRGEYSEFASLIEHFNRMLERLEGSFTQATRFSADAAHELKTPLAILQGQLEVALQGAEDGSESQGLLAGLLEEAHRLKSITRKLLILAKADAGTLEIQRERVDLKQLTSDLIELAREDDPSLDLEFVADGEVFDSLCDDTLSRQILNNLIGNALKYRMPVDSKVTIRMEARPNFIVIEIANRCEAIGADTRARLFDRFIRGDKARSRSLDGTGLGLSLSLEFAKAQGGRLSQVDGVAEDEMKIRLELPAFGSSSAAVD